MTSNDSCGNKQIYALRLRDGLLGRAKDRDSFGCTHGRQTCESTCTLRYWRQHSLHRTLSSRVKLDGTKLKLTIKKGEAALVRGVLFGSNRSIIECIRIRIETWLHFSTVNAELGCSISKWPIEKYEISRKYANPKCYHPIKRLSAFIVFISAH